MCKFSVLLWTHPNIVYGTIAWQIYINVIKICDVHQFTFADQFPCVICPEVDKVCVNICPSSGIHGPQIPPFP